MKKNLILAQELCEKAKKDYYNATHYYKLAMQKTVALFKRTKLQEAENFAKSIYVDAFHQFLDHKNKCFEHIDSCEHFMKDTGAPLSEFKERIADNIAEIAPVLTNAQKIMDLFRLTFPALYEENFSADYWEITETFKLCFVQGVIHFRQEQFDTAYKIFRALHLSDNLSGLALETYINSIAFYSLEFAQELEESAYHKAYAVKAYAIALKCGVECEKEYYNSIENFLLACAFNCEEIGNGPHRKNTKNKNLRFYLQAINCFLDLDYVCNNVTNSKNNYNCKEKIAEIENKILLLDKSFKKAIEEFYAQYIPLNTLTEIFYAQENYLTVDVNALPIFASQYLTFDYHKYLRKVDAEDYKTVKLIKKIKENNEKK